jgi:hypothetical protein
MAATSTMRSGFGTAQSAGTLIGGQETTSSDSLVAILASCSNMGSLQGEAACSLLIKILHRSRPAACSRSCKLL